MTAAAAAGLLGATGVSPARASAMAATCYVEDTIVQSYGLTMDPHASTFRSESAGVLSCAGTVRGAAISGPGQFTEVGHTNNTWCGAGSGWSRIAGSLPTSAGTVPLRGIVHWNRVGLTMTFSGTLDGLPVDGALAAHPQNGNCNLDHDDPQPVTRVTLRGSAVLHD